MIQPLRAYRLGARSVSLCTVIALSGVAGAGVSLFAQQRVYTGQAVRRDSAREPSTSQNTCTTLDDTSCPPAIDALPEGWNAVDVGSRRQAGATAHVDGAFGLAAKGGDVGGTADQFHFAYHPASGDVDVIARLISVDSKHARTLAGVMIRASLAAGAADAFVYVSAGQDLGFRNRPSIGAQTTDAAAIAEPMPVWLKLELRASVVSAYSSTDGRSWEFVRSEILTLPPTFVVGLALTGGQDSRAVGVFDHVEIRQASSASASGTSSPVAGGAPVIAEAPAPPTPTTPTLPPAIPTPPPASTVPPAPGGPATPNPEAPNPAPPGATPIPAPGQPAPPPSVRPPFTLVFVPSSDHVSNVDRYVFAVVSAGAAPVTVLERSIGKPLVVNGEIRVDITDVLSQVPPGSYVGRVTAVNEMGSSQPESSLAFVY